MPAEPDDLPTTKWFHPDAEGWDAPVCRDCPRVEVPKTPCGYCGKAFEPTDFGIVLPFLGSETDPKELGYHHHCFADLLGIEP